MTTHEQLRDWEKEFDVIHVDSDCVLHDKTKSFIRSLLSQASKEAVEVRKKYGELIYAVARKFPNETRHETALRYIQEAEMSALSGDAVKNIITKK